MIKARNTFLVATLILKSTLQKTTDETVGTFQIKIIVTKLIQDYQYYRATVQMCSSFSETTDAMK